MALINAVNTSLSGQTGTGAFVGANSPALITPDLGAAIASSVQFSPSTDGIIGTTTNNNATAGRVGEFLESSIVSGSATALTNGVVVDLTSISLTAGDWDIWGNVSYIIVTGPCLSVVMWSSPVSATLPVGAAITTSLTVSTGTLLNGTGAPIPSQRYSVNAPTTVYLSVQANFSGGTVSAYGNIFARRMR